MGRRQVIDLSGMGHRAPISLAVRIDNIVYSSGISGRDAEMDAMPEDAAGQAKAMFRNIERVMEAAGGSPPTSSTCNCACRIARSASSWTRSGWPCSLTRRIARRVTQKRRNLAAACSCSARSWLSSRSRRGLAAPQARDALNKSPEVRRSREGGNLAPL